MKRLVAVLCALAVSLVVWALWNGDAPSDGDIRRLICENPVSPRPDSALWDSPSLLADLVEVRAEAGEDVRFLLGSSELSQSIEDSAYPVRFFENHNFGFRVMCIGGAGYQSLWSAIETGALDAEGAIPGKKIALLLGTCWFYDGGCSQEAFLNSFSEEAFRECMGNPGLTEKTKRAISQRVAELGVDSRIIADLSNNTFIGEVNQAFGGLLSGGDRRRELARAIGNSCTGLAPEASSIEVDYDWDALMGEVESQGRAACTNNSIGINNWYYDEYAKSWIEENEAREVESFTQWSDKEFADLSLFLDVCRDLGIEPLLVLEPAKGQYYDATIYDSESRELFYARMRTFLSDAKVSYLDLSEHAYDLYYLRDVMHMAWKGWAEIDRALVMFYGEDKTTSVSGWTPLDLGFETSAERAANEAMENMLEVEGAGKEVFDGSQKGD